MRQVARLRVTPRQRDSELRCIAAIVSHPLTLSTPPLLVPSSPSPHYCVFFSFKSPVGRLVRRCWKADRLGLILPVNTPIMAASIRRGDGGFGHFSGVRARQWSSFSRHRNSRCAAHSRRTPCLARRLHVIGVSAAVYMIFPSRNGYADSRIAWRVVVFVARNAGGVGCVLARTNLARTTVRASTHPTELR
jgi:hypothetical protein